MREYITLSTLTEAVATTLSVRFSHSVWVTAEIASLREHVSGHCYIELVETDEKTHKELARMRATIWKGRYGLLKAYFYSATQTPLQEGLRVLLEAKVSYHPVYGLSLNITDVDPSYTLGAVEQARRQTIARLQAEGVFDMNRTLSFPELPRRIAVISAIGAAGLGDFQAHLKEAIARFGLRVELFEARMQGATAAQSVISALERVADSLDSWDIVVILRGGGSLLDLACFDDYALAAHVAQFPLPVISGIGHERDVSVVDLVAHYSLKTPTAVADFLGEIFFGAERDLQALSQRLRATITQQAMRHANALQVTTSLVRSAIGGQLNAQRQALAPLPPSLVRGVRWHIALQRRQLEERVSALRQATRYALAQQEGQLRLAQEVHQLGNPLRLLDAGYVMVYQSGQRVRRMADVAMEQPLDLQFHDGRLQVEVAGGATTLPPEQFVAWPEGGAIIDVRSPSEFRQGHVPGAVNVPLFDDAARAEVGTFYHKQGRSVAIARGMELVGPRLSTLYSECCRVAEGKSLRMYCWRGGMRSASMAWLAGRDGLKVYLLEGGYKAYRRLVLDSFGQPRQLAILGGMTGSGKSEVLHEMALQGAAVIDLEGLARHKGSAFGWLGQGDQPSTEMFENCLFEAFRRCPPEQPVWLEDESRNIGRVVLPGPLFDAMLAAPMVILELPPARRVQRLVEEYGQFPPAQLIECIEKIRRRLGGDVANACVEKVQAGDIAGAVRGVLSYYDRQYQHAIGARAQSAVEVSGGDAPMADVARAVMQAWSSRFSRTEA